MKLADIHTKYYTDKGTQHSYIESYDRLLEPYQHKSIQMCEIGCLGGGSLKMFEEYFSNGTIVGVDNWIQTSNNTVDLFNIGFNGVIKTVSEIKGDIEKNHTRIKLITCDSTNLQQVNQELSSMKFDVIIDDGDHWHEAQFSTFKNFFPLLNHGGIYIVEDVRHYKELAENIQHYLDNHNINYTVEIETFFKNNWDDDVLVIVKPNVQTTV